MRAPATCAALVAYTAGLLLLPPAVADPGTPWRAVCQHPWAGVYPTTLLPWCCDGAVDVPSLEAQLRYQLAGGVTGILVLGSIGEGESASAEARDCVVQTAVRVVNGCGPVIVGIHTCDVEKATAQVLHARDLGAAAVLVKYKGHPRASGCQVLAFYQCLSDLAALPILYYHYPGDTDLKLSPAELARILRLPGVIGMKASTLDLDELEDVVKLTRGCGKVFLSGTALNTTQFLDAGGHGLMCPEAVLLPGRTVCAYRLACAGRTADARDVQRELFVVAPALSGGLTTERIARKRVMIAQDLGQKLPVRDTHPQARLKAVLNGIGVPTTTRVSAPLPGLRPRDRDIVERAVEHIRARHLAAAVP